MAKLMPSPGAAVMRLCIFSSLCIAFTVAGPAHSRPSKYVVDGIPLGASASNAVKKYECTRSDDFPEFLWCKQTRESGNRTISKTILHEWEHGAAAYLMVDVAAASLDRDKVEKELRQLSDEFKEQPFFVQWLPSRKGSPNAVVAVWGGVGLEGLDKDALSTLAAGESPHQGVLVDYLGDVHRSARTGFPVFRMAGGPGYVFSASFDDKGRGHRHYVAIDASQLSQPQVAQTPQPQTSPAAAGRGAVIGVETLDLIKRANIVIIGDIWSADGERFRRVAVDLIRQGYWIGQVKTFSRGGSVDAALSMGEQIHLLRASTAAPTGSSNRGGVRVCQTSLAPGGAIDSSENSNCDCTSACFFIWAGGSGREGDVIGVHRMSYTDFATKPVEEARRMYAEVIKRTTDYLEQMGIPENIRGLTFATSSAELRYLTRQELAPILGFPPAIEELKIARCGPRPADHVSDAVRLAYYNCTEGIQAEDSRIGAKEYMRKFGGERLQPRPASVNVPTVEEDRFELKGSFWDHNGSLMHLVVNGRSRRFYYKNPRPAMKTEGVSQGTLLFDGNREGRRFVGKAFIFGCGRSFEYHVSGPISKDENTVTLSGKAPLLDENCNRIGDRDDKLIFKHEAIPRSPLSSFPREAGRD
jgi:hypothetical protein